MPFLFPEGTPRLFRCITTYSIGGSEHPFHSVHYYLATNDTGSASDLGTEFGDLWGNSIAPIVSELCDAFAVTTVNLGSPTDFHVFVPDVDGEVTGDLLAPWDCWVFRESTGNRLAPYGYKRIGYLTENAVQSGGAAIGAIADELDAYATFLSASYSTGSVTYNPVLVSPANESHDDDLVLPFIDAIYQKHGHAIGRKSY